MFLTVFAAMVLAQKHTGVMVSGEKLQFNTTSRFQSMEIENTVLPKEKDKHNVKISVLVTNFV
jgi:hypothetical protein